jgi:hypothetical protein
MAWHKGRNTSESLDKQICACNWFIKNTFAQMEMHGVYNIKIVDFDVLNVLYSACLDVAVCLEFTL